MQFLCEDNHKKFGPSNDFENQQFKIDILMHVSSIITTFIFNQGTIYTEELCIYKWRQVKNGNRASDKKCRDSDQTI